MSVPTPTVNTRTPRAQAQVGRGANDRRREIVGNGVDLEHRNVVFGMPADDFRLRLKPIGEHNSHSPRCLMVRKHHGRVQ